MDEAKLARRPRRRDDLPLAWPGAGRFSDDRADSSQLDLVRLAKRCPLLDDLREACAFDSGWGRPREPGEAVLALLAYVHSGHVDVEPWWRETAEDLWLECGFGYKPRYELVRDRFLELERVSLEDLFDAGAKLVAWAIEQAGGRICFDLHLDCTEADSNVRLHHDCGPEDGCPGWHRGRRNRHGQLGDARRGPLAAASRAEARALRQKVNQGEIDDEDARLDGAVQRVIVDEERGVLRVRLGEHWWTCRDMTAGVRAFTGERGASRVWTGFNALKVTCRTLGETILHLFEAADVQEYALFDEAIERVEAITGSAHVRSVNFDTGFSTKNVYQACAQRGITAVAPYRRYKGDPGRPQDHDAHDRDGVPRCKGCGGPTEFVRYGRGEKPRVWFVCAAPRPACPAKPDGSAAEQSLTIHPETGVDPRYVLPVWRTTEAYQALKERGLEMERAHHASRTRNRVAGKDVLARPKRIGRDWQQLRANASVICDWLKVLRRQGWLPQTVTAVDAHDTLDVVGAPLAMPDTGVMYKLSRRRNLEHPYLVGAEGFVDQVWAERRREGLLGCYGPQAEKLGIGPLRLGDPERRAVDLDFERPPAEPDTRVATTPDGITYDPATGEILDDQTASAPEQGRGALPPPE